MSAASDKLAQTRLALIAHIQRRDRRADRDDARHGSQGETGEEPWEEEPDDSAGPGAWFSHVKRMATAWWRQHPAHLGLELATPALSAYAARKPLQFLGIAAALGAIVMVTRPWRVISATGLVVALVKSSQLSSVLMSAMSAADFQKDHQPRR
jgi:hypothetical protein